MKQLAVKALINAALFIIKSYLKEKALLEVVINGLDVLVKSTENTFDDKIVKPIRDEYEKKYGKLK